MICDKTYPKTQPDEIHNAFSTDAVSDYVRCLSEFAQLTNKVVLDLRAGFVGTDDKTFVSQVVPRQSLSVCQQMLLGQGDMDRLLSQYEAIAILRRKATGCDNGVEPSMAE